MFSEKIKLIKKIDGIPFCLFFIMFFIRLSLISKGVYHIDCLILLQQALKTLETGHLQYLSGLGFPLTVFLGAVFVAVGKFLHFQTPEFWINLTAVVFSSLTVTVFYLFIKEFLNSKPIAIFSSILLSVTPIFLGLSVYGKSHMPCMYFLMQALYFLIIYSKKQQMRYFILAAICFGLMGAARIVDFGLLFIPVSCLIFLMVFKKESLFFSKVKGYILFIGVSFFSLGLFYALMILGNQGGGFFHEMNGQVEYGFSANFLGILTPSLLAAGKFLMRSMSWVGVLFSCVGFFILFRRKKVQTIFLILWIVVPVLFYGNLRMTVTSRYFILIMPPLMLGIGVAVNWFYEKKYWVRKLGILIFILLVAHLFLKIYPILKFRHNQATLTEFVQWVETMVEPNAQIIAADEAGFYDYYTGLSTHGRPTYMDKTPEQDLKAFQRDMDGYLKQKIPVYMTTASLYAYDRNQNFSNFILDHYRLRVVGEHLYESWHTGAMDFNVFPCELYRLEMKN